jgi:two-component system sensor histidine kinase KdpD
MGSTLSEQRLEVKVPDSLPDVDVDHVLIVQALVNLLDNAARHSPPHGVVTVRGERRSEEIVVSVSDQGPGVPPADRETIFDRFTQLDTGGRAGLGLTIAKTFVEAHGEHVWYEEAPDGGARFIFSLPRTDARGH